MAPNDEFYELNVGNILGGKFPELFNKAIQQLIDNMRDVNTPADSVRKIKFEFTFKPTDDRQTAAGKKSCSMNLPQRGSSNRRETPDD